MSRCVCVARNDRLPYALQQQSVFGDGYGLTEGGNKVWKVRVSVRVHLFKQPGRPAPDQSLRQTNLCGSKYRTTPAPVSFDCCISFLSFSGRKEAREEDWNKQLMIYFSCPGGITRLSRLWWRRLARLQSACCVVRSSAHVDCDDVAVPSDHMEVGCSRREGLDVQCKLQRISMSVYHFILSHLSRLGDTVGQGRAGLTMSNGNQVECPREENHESQRLRLIEEGDRVLAL
jgi:hypothetical protein